MAAKANKKGAGSLAGSSEGLLFTGDNRPALASRFSPSAGRLPPVLTVRGFVWQVPCKLADHRRPDIPVLSSFSLHEMNLWCGDCPMP